jgi:hypothetical protein
MVVGVRRMRREKEWRAQPYRFRFTKRITPPLLAKNVIYSYYENNTDNR